MSRPRMRPEFTRPLRAPEAFLRLLRERLAAPHGAASEAGTAGECRGQVRAGGALLRLCDAECRVDDSGVRATATTPASASHAIPGCYMLWLVSSAGVPSVARWVFSE